ncbi:dephospho-CoA kinase [Spiroplasma floricola]|uniref:Dephospho-CoA kinase n=1 Tax=Spiroplasma floricola 23-6 TaxID=1336749 RepID=A0A2K8SEH3_9MOLU|nr:dephospho-CoA kinase [Spiroplasma floricola]AUB31658.1 dephospho-CoA kinase [Spiroplasma floricola 23-6]
MKIIGVSGFIGSGKTTMLQYLDKNPKIKIIEADEISKKILYEKELIEFIKQKIPNALINEQIDRLILRQELFNNHKLNNEFTKIAWPLITKEIKNEILIEKQAELIFIEAAVISGIDIKFDKTILLVKNHSQRIKRVEKRDNRNCEEIDSITEFQKEKLKDYKFDYILENNSDKKTFYKNIDSLVELIK